MSIELTPEEMKRDFLATCRDHIERCGADGDIEYHLNKIGEKYDITLARYVRLLSEQTPEQVKIEVTSELGKFVDRIISHDRKLSDKDISNDKWSELVFEDSKAFREYIFTLVAAQIAEAVKKEREVGKQKMAKELYDDIICPMCYRLNPQHASADRGIGCKSCPEKEYYCGKP